MPDEPQSSKKSPANSAELHRHRSTTPMSRLGPPIFRFDLQQLLWFVAILSGLLTAVVSLPGLGGAALLLAAFVVAAHFFSTALGSRLRSQADEAILQRAREVPIRASGTEQRDAERRATAISALKRSPWHRRGSTSLPWLPRLIIAGIVAGGMIGAMLLAATIGHRTSAAGILVGSASLAVVGGWLAFLCGSFYGIFRHGLRDALAEQQKDEAPKQMPQ
jgi:hypothetical protein